MTNVAANDYTVAAKAYGRLGGNATSAVVNLFVAGNAAPSIALSAMPASPVAPATNTVTAIVSDADGSVTKVEFFNGSTLLASDTQAPFSYVWSGVGANTYDVKAVATDNLGAKTSVSQALTVAPATQAGAPNVYFIHADQINTPREITNAAGVKVWEAGNDAFGAALPNENPAGQGKFAYNVRFPGQYFDQETGLHYNYFRDYDPQTGRYLQSDPIGLQGGVNTYGYVEGNPVSKIDPTGEIAFLIPFVPAGVSFVQASLFVGSAAAVAYGAHQITKSDECPPEVKKGCPPCKTTSGRIVPPGTLGYRPLDVIPDNEVQHGRAGSHHNIFIAGQNPNNCQCFWSKQKYVLKPGELPSGAVPVEPFVN